MAYERTSCFYFRLRLPAIGPVTRQPDLPSGGVLNARESIAAAREIQTPDQAAGTVGFLARVPRGRALVRAARSGLQFG